jgi:hypothetical protein
MAQKLLNSTVFWTLANVQKTSQKPLPNVRNLSSFGILGDNMFGFALHP